MRGVKTEAIIAVLYLRVRVAPYYGTKDALHCFFYTPLYPLQPGKLAMPLRKEEQEIHILLRRPL